MERNKVGKFILGVICAICGLALSIGIAEMHEREAYAEESTTTHYSISLNPKYYYNDKIKVYTGSKCISNVSYEIVSGNKIVANGTITISNNKLYVEGQTSVSLNSTSEYTLSLSDPIVKDVDNVEIKIASFTKTMEKDLLKFNCDVDVILKDISAITITGVTSSMKKTFPTVTDWDDVSEYLSEWIYYNENEPVITIKTDDGSTRQVVIDDFNDEEARYIFDNGTTTGEFTVYLSFDKEDLYDPYELADYKVPLTITIGSPESSIKSYDKITIVVDSSSDPEIDDDLEDMAIADKRNILLGVYNNSSADVKKAISEAVASEKKISFSVSAKKISNNDKIKNKEKREIEEEAEDGASGATVNYYYFDLTVTLYIEEKEIGEVENTGSDISFEIYVPDSIRKKTSSSSTNSSRKYKIIRYHDDSADSMSDYDEDSPIEFKSHKFSTYAIAYYDKTSSASNTSSSINSRSASVKDTLDTTSGNNASGKSPKTGDDFNPRIWIYLLIVAATIATCAGVLLHDTKDTDEAERK